MQLTVTTNTELTFTLNVSDDLELENFKAFCEFESGFPATEMIVLHNNQPLTDDKKGLKDYGIVEGDMIMLQHVPAARPPTRSPARPSLSKNTKEWYWRLSYNFCLF